MIKKYWYIVLLIAITFIMVWLSYGKKAEAVAQNPCEKYCDDWNWNHTVCEDWDWRLCHHTPSNTVTHNFNNESSCNNHLGTPHSGSTYDTYGACSTVSPTPSPSPSPTPTPIPPSPTPTPIPEEPKDYCENLEGNQEELPVGMVSEEGVCSCTDGYHKVEPEEANGLLTLVRKEYDNFTCEKDEEPKPEPEPQPQPQPENKPSGCTGDCSAPAPQCGSSNTTNQVINFHVYRNGDDAILKWWATEGNKVNIYWKNPSATNWEHATQTDNFGYAEIHGLGTHDWTFGIQQVNDCGGGLVTVGKIMEVVDGNTHNWVLFR